MFILVYIAFLLTKTEVWITSKRLKQSLLTSFDKLHIFSHFDIITFRFVKTITNTLGSTEFRPIQKLNEENVQETQKQKANKDMLIVCSFLFL